MFSINFDTNRDALGWEIITCNNVFNMALCRLRSLAFVCHLLETSGLWNSQYCRRYHWLFSSCSWNGWHSVDDFDQNW